MKRYFFMVVMAAFAWAFTACGDYQFPLGTPVLVGKRGTSDGVDYIYEVESNGAKSTIYVTVGNGEGAKPEFTRVVR